VTQCTDKIENFPPYLGIADFGECTGKLNPLGTIKKADDICGLALLLEPFGLVGLTRHVVKEKCDRHIENIPDSLQAAGADPVHALFVFLDLLKCYSQAFTQFFLAQSNHVASQPNACTHVYIYWVWSLLISISHKNLIRMK
jgi:hypothetical protein